jgi:hypothetical protein
MNNDDLERQLRTQAGPREQGYRPARLPSTPDKKELRHPSPLLRVAVLVPAMAAGVLVIAVAAAVLRGPGTSVGANETPTPFSAATTPPESGICQPDDVAITAEPWGGAAGSRGTVVSISLAGTREQCSMNTGFSVQVTDDSGRLLASDSKDTFAGTVYLSSMPDNRAHVARTWTVGIAWSNWCGDAPAEPMHLYLTFPAEWNAPKEVAVPAGGADPVPPCMGSSQQTSLSVTDLQKAN